MKILINVFDEHSQIKHERVIDLEANDVAEQIINILALAVKKECPKVVMHLHER